MSSLFRPGDLRVDSLDLHEAVQIILDECPKTFRHAVSDAKGRFLYRGEEAVTFPTVLSPKSDLLDIETYGEEKAVAFFLWMEREMEGDAAIRPSVAHIGVARKRVAQQWGNPVSVWPLGETFHYLWPKNRDLIYPGVQSRDSLVIDRDLSDALSHGKEIMFVSFGSKRQRSSFLAVPAENDKIVRTLLEARSYGLC